jgi:hypothetical protein
LATVNLAFLSVAFAGPIIFDHPAFWTSRRWRLFRICVASSIFLLVHSHPYFKLR